MYLHIRNITYLFKYGTYFKDIRPHFQPYLDCDVSNV